LAYTTIAELRALDGLDSTTVYPDATLTDAITYATELIDGYCGTSFEEKAFSVTLDGNNSLYLWVGVLFIQSLTSVTVDGVAQTLSDIVARPEGVIVHKNGIFTWQYWGQNIVVEGTAGVTTTVPESIARAARIIARQYCLDLKSRLPARARLLTNELGQIELYQRAGAQGSPTGIPDVDAILNRNKHKPGMAGAVFG
jgi:hypothetical protein